MPSDRATHRYAYLHGFASSGRSRKALHLADAFAKRGAALERPELNVPSFAELTYSGALGVMDSLDAATPASAGGTGPPPWRLIGSSMGGAVAARWAELHPERADRLVLLCPGFDLASRWPALLGEERMRRWRDEGALEFPDAAGVPTLVRFALVLDALRHPPQPEVPCPTLILHGRADAVVPIETSRAYARSHPHVRLVELDDDHALAGSLDRIAAETLAFFGLDYRTA